jgi:membrane fusion protein, multidrug efflux system
MSQAATAQTATTLPRETATAPATGRSRRRSRALRPLLMLGGIAVVAAGAFLYWLEGGRYVSIDDSYVEAAKISLSTDVSGPVQVIPVHEGEKVRQGDELFRLDPRQFEIALAGARANLAQIALTLASMKQDYQRMLRDVTARDAQVQADQARFGRFNSLVQTGDVTRQDFDDTRYKLAADQAALDAARQAAAVQLAKLGGNSDAPVSAMPSFLQAQAQVDEAQRELDHTVVGAPFAGVVTMVDHLQPGQYLPANTAAFGLVSSDHVWVEANPKETELTWVQPGDPVKVVVDTYPGRIWDGVVESVAPNSGSEFSILPAQNSSGNWVKVVQRIPLRVRVNRHPGDPELRSGMSVEVEIDTGHQRHISDLY